MVHCLRALAILREPKFDFQHTHSVALFCVIVSVPADVTVVLCIVLLEHSVSC